MPPQDEFPEAGPNCPQCGGPMVLRTARRGPNAGNRFWGCGSFPACRGTRDFENANEQETLLPQNRESIALPVQWHDHAQRRGWITEYVNIAAVPGFFRDIPGAETLAVKRALGQTILLRREAHDHSPTPDQTFASGILLKILQRGNLPPVTLETERQILEKHGLLAKATALGNGQYGWELPPELIETTSPGDIVASATARTPFVLIEQLTAPLMDSPREAKFLNEWVPQAISPSAGHWFIPQAPLDRLLDLTIHGQEDVGDRRMDFLFAYPGTPPFGIELDGPEHEAATQVDAARDVALQELFDVIRIPNHELDSGNGPNLTTVRDRCAHLFHEDISSTPVADAVVEAAFLAKVQFAIVKAIEWGWLASAGRWHIKLEGVDRIAIFSIQEIIDLVAGLEQLYGLDIAPTEVAMEADGVTEQWRADADSPPSINASEESRLTIRLERNEGPFAAIRKSEEVDIIIRPSFAPVQFSSQITALEGRRMVQIHDGETAENILRQYLKQIFRKSDFRPNQAKAILRTLQNRDTVVLLPTGAGKSIIYQLAGLLMPGITLVVDPIIALIDDQQEGLAEHGIDRTGAVTSAVTGNLRREIERRIEQAEFLFVFVAPERLQHPTFRTTLHSLNQSSCINLAVIDEAHCVSEWGHDFRPAYLNLAGNLRKFGTREDAPSVPILALTGTAARAVLRDMIADMGISREDPDAIIRPSSFDRQELRYEIKTTTPNNSAATLRGILNALPAKFRLPRTEFFRPRGKSTLSGIIFVPTVGGQVHGAAATRREVRDTTDANVTIYTGSPPPGFGTSGQWNLEKTENAKNFKTNQYPILVATNAYGMGIDKPNIRYTIHFGMPQSLESFYQEAGRAGRDGNEAWCIIVFTENDPSRSDRLLDARHSIESLRQEHGRIQGPGTRDDVVSALWFHLKSFSGLANEKEHIHQIARELGEFEQDLRSIEIPLGNDELPRDKRERALHRLVKVGAVLDYEVDYGGQKIKVYMDRYDPERWKQCAVEYVRAAQPARAERYAHQAQELFAPSQNESSSIAVQLAVMLIDFTYDVIEKSRRRMIQEAMLLARDAGNEDDFRQRLLNYLQEGVGSEDMLRLVEEEIVKFQNWINLTLSIMTPIEAGELRGLSIRLLESYPDHPGLLVVRALSEAFTNEPNEEIIRQSLDAALEGSVDNYAVEKQEILTLVNHLFSVARRRTAELAPSLANVVLGKRLDEEKWAFMVEPVLEQAKTVNHPHIQASYAIQRLFQLATKLEDVVSLVSQLSASPQFCEVEE